MWHLQKLQNWHTNLPTLEYSEFFAILKELLLDITEDGVIDESEKADMRKILETLEELESVAQNLKVWVKKNL